MRLKLFLFALVSFFHSLSFAADTQIYSHKKHGAIRGADVVAYYELEAGEKAILGKKSISHEYKGATWYFSTEANRDLFAANPEKYAPQYGGYCAYAVSQGTTASVQPDRWHIVDDKLYLNYNRSIEKKWYKDKDTAIQQADANWPNVLEGS